jgi:hypothetical protein
LEACHPSALIDVAIVVDGVIGAPDRTPAEEVGVITIESDIDLDDWE